MEEGETESNTNQDPSVLQSPAVNWAKYIGVRSLQNEKMGHPLRKNAKELNNWDLRIAFKGTGKTFSTDHQLLLTETTNEPKLLNTLCASNDRNKPTYPKNTLLALLKNNYLRDTALCFTKTVFSYRRILERRSSVSCVRDIPPSIRCQRWEMKNSYRLLTNLTKKSNWISSDQSLK